MTSAGSPRRSRVVVTLLLAVATALATVAFPVLRPPPPCPGGGGGTAPTSPIRHVFLIVKENHAFANYFATFPGTTGYPPTGVVPASNGSPPTVAQFPLPGSSTDDLPHDRAAAVADLDGGKNDLFVAEAADRGAVAPTNAMGYYPAGVVSPYFSYARNYSLADHFFSGVLGPTLPNRIFDIAGTSGGWTSDEAPPGGWGTFPTLLDQLNAAGLPWSYYYTGNEVNLAPTLFPSLGSASCRAGIVEPLSSLPADLASDSPPSVAFVDPSHDPTYSEHPPENVTLGADWTVSVVNQILTSPVGPSSAIFVFYDEYGGFYDPVPPPALDALGDGFRVPLLVLSPWTHSGTLVTSPLDPAALLRFVEANWALAPLNARVASAPGIGEFFAFGAPARAPLLLPTPVNFTHATANASLPASTLSSGSPPPGSERVGPAAARGSLAWATPRTIWLSNAPPGSCRVGSSPSTGRSRSCSNPKGRSSRSPSRPTPTCFS